MKTSLSLSIRRVGIKYHWASFSVPLNEFQQFDVNVFYESSLSSRQPFRGVGSNWLFHHPIVWSRSRSISSWAVGWYVAWLVLIPGLVELFLLDVLVIWLNVVLKYYSGLFQMKVDKRAEFQKKQVSTSWGCQQESGFLRITIALRWYTFIREEVSWPSPRLQSHRWGVEKVMKISCVELGFNWVRLEGICWS